MKQKLLELKELFLKGAHAAPLAVGVALGYIFHAELQVALSIIGTLIKGLLHIL